MWRFILLICILATPVDAAVPLPYNRDLTRDFRTRSRWEVVITQGPSTYVRGEDAIEDQEVGAIKLCFRSRSRTLCPNLGIVGRAGLFENEIHRVKVVRADTEPLLLVHTWGSVYALAFSSGATTWLWAYRPQRDRFELVFSNQTGLTNNQETRFVDRGPLAGDIIVALNPPPGSPPPYSYTISVYRYEKGSTYRQILHYTARSNQNDQNDLAVIDAEMPTIEKRLHIWRDGQPLPTPKFLPTVCKGIVLRHGIEVCVADHGRS